MNSNSDEEYFILAGLEILESRKSSSKSIHCYGCGNLIKSGSLLVCAECLSGECETFEELAIDD